MTIRISNRDTVTKIFTLASFVIPFLVLAVYQGIMFPSYPYYYYKKTIFTNTFEVTWKGRTYYLFFLWLFFLEMILDWEKIKPIKYKSKLVGGTVLGVSHTLPIIYVLVANFYGLNKGIVDLTYRYGVPFADWMPLSVEFLVLAALFTLALTLTYGINGLRNFSISTVFLGIIGLIFTIDNLYPYGAFLPFQFLVPTTATLAASVLNLMGYQTMFTVPMREGMPHLVVTDSRQSWGASIGWSCSGIDSLLIYTITILLFLRRSIIPTKQRIAYFAFGAAITYFINILRIVTIFIIGLNNPIYINDAWQTFHDYYGPLYSIAWILSYPLIIIGSRTAWGKIRQWRIKQKSTDTST